MAKKKVFVLMPFDEELAWVYTELIKPAFEGTGCEVARADDFEHQQNILTDIVGSILDADIIVADLTLSNPNVYYELGLAHARGKGVVLMTQDVDGVPFDLKSYRVFQYDDSASRLRAKAEELKSLAQAIFRGDIVFGNPVSDFERRGVAIREIPRKDKAANQAGRDSDDEDDSDSGPEENKEHAAAGPGLLDAASRIEEGFEAGRGVLDAIRDHIEGLGSEAAERAPELQKLMEARNVRGARNLLRALGHSYDKRRQELRTLNKKLRDAWGYSTSGLEAMWTHPAISHQQRTEMLEMARGLCGNAKTAGSELKGLISSLNGLPALEHMFDRAKRGLVLELMQLGTFLKNDVEQLEGRLVGMAALEATIEEKIEAESETDGSERTGDKSRQPNDASRRKMMLKSEFRREVLRLWREHKREKPTADPFAWWTQVTAQRPDLTYRRRRDVDLWQVVQGWLK